MRDNIFKVLGIQSREDCISNALAYAFNESIDFRNGFLRTVCSKNPETFTECTAYSRVSIRDSGIPDLVFVCKSGDEVELIIIENKIKAEEGDDQTERYAVERSVDTLRQKLCPFVEREKVKASFIFLTLFPDQRPCSKKFITKTHSALAAIYSGEIVVSNLADQLISDWLTLVKSFYSKSRIHPEDKICEKLQDDDGLDGGHLYFRQILSQLTLPEGLQIEGFFRDSRQGRRYYGTVFSKNLWHPGKLTESNGKWSLEPDRVFNIHFEPQFSVLNGMFSIFLHYEINPYETAAWARKHIPSEQYDKYLKRRSRFVAALSEANAKDWTFGGGTNQIAKVRMDFQSLSSRDAQTAIERIFSECSISIDQILGGMA